MQALRTGKVPFLFSSHRISALMLSRKGMTVALDKAPTPSRAEVSTISHDSASAVISTQLYLFGCSGSNRLRGDGDIEVSRGELHRVVKRKYSS